MRRGVRQHAQRLAPRGNIEADGGTWSEVEEAEFKQPIKDAFDQQSDPYFATARLWDDGISRRAKRAACSR